MNTKSILKYGIIFTVIYGAVLLLVTFYSGRLRPAELGFIVPLWLLGKPFLMNHISLSSSSFTLVMVTMQVLAAFIQGAIIGLILHLFMKKRADNNIQ